MSAILVSRTDTAIEILADGAACGRNTAWQRQPEAHPALARPCFWVWDFACAITTSMPQ